MGPLTRIGILLASALMVALGVFVGGGDAADMPKAWEYVPTVFGFIGGVLVTLALTSESKYDEKKLGDGT